MILQSPLEVPGKLLDLAVLALLSTPLLAQAPVVLEVGPAGTYATIQEAIDAVVVGQNTEIRVQGLETYTENLSIPATFTSGTILLSGGWDDSFVIHNDEPEDTIIDGNGNTVLDIAIGGGSLEVRAFAITNGSATQGAGVFIMPSGNATVTLNKVLVAENTATNTGDALGGGLWAILSGSQSLEIRDSAFYGNRAVSTGGGLAIAGGVGIGAAGDSRVLIGGTDIGENSVESSGSAVSGGGLFLEIEDTAEVELLDVTLNGNTGDSSSGDVAGIGGWWRTRDSAVLRAGQIGCVFNNGVGGDSGPQISSGR